VNPALERKSKEMAMTDVGGKDSSVLEEFSAKKRRELFISIPMILVVSMVFCWCPTYSG
jgi:hypothetical protein